MDVQGTVFPNKYGYRWLAAVCSAKHKLVKLNFAKLRRRERSPPSLEDKYHNSISKPSPSLEDKCHSLSNLDSSSSEILPTSQITFRKWSCNIAKGLGPGGDATFRMNV